MKVIDRARFARCMAALSVVFDRYRLSEDQQALRASAYFEALAGYEVDEIEAAVRRLVDVGRSFPLPIDLREEINRGRRDRRLALAATEREQRMLPVATKAEAQAREEARGKFFAEVRSLTARFAWAPRPQVWLETEIQALHERNAAAKATDPEHHRRVDQAHRDLERLSRGAP